MADIELIVKVSEEDYKSIKDDVEKFLSMPSHKVPILYEAINKGVPLPKGHGRLIDADKFEAFVIRTNGDEEFVNGVQYVLEKIDNAPTVEAIPKADYEARLKADMVAMLTDIQLEIEELKNDPTFCHHYKRGINRSSDIIQQKIDVLKEKNNAKTD